MTAAEIHKYGKRIRSQMPLFGGWLRKTACKRLAENVDHSSSPYLIEAVESGDPELVSIAGPALRKARATAVVELLCEAAMKNPNGKTATLCREEKRRPVDSKTAVRFFLATGQEQGLRELSQKNDSEALCDAALADPNGTAAKVCIETGKRPVDPEKACRLWVATKQEKVLRGLTLKPEVEALCRLALAAPGGLAETVCKESGKRPVDSTDACKFFIATQQEQRLRDLTEKNDVDALCALATAEPKGLGAKVCIETAKRPADPEKAVRLWVATKQDAVLRGIKGGGEAGALYRLAIETPGGLAESICKEIGVRPEDSAEACKFFVATKQEKRLRDLTEAKDIEALCALATADTGGLAAKVCIETGKRPADPEKACRLYIATKQEKALTALTNRNDIDALCRIAMREPKGIAAKICIDTRKRPSDPEELCLFLVITRQLNEYEKEDSEFQNLRPAYDRADPDLQAKVMEVYRSGARQLDGFIGTGDERIGGTKKLEDCSDDIIQHFIDLRLRHKEWPKLFAAFLRMPLRFGLPLLAHFKSSGWEPDAPDSRSLLRGALAEWDANESAAAGSNGAPTATSAVFDRWLREGRARDVEGGEQQLLDKLRTAAPPEGVRLVAALAASGKAGEVARKAVRESPHWMVRLAGAAVGLTPLGLATTPDGNYWMRELTPSYALMDLWPSKATPLDLEALASAPPEAWTGEFGKARRILRLLLAREVGTQGDFEDVEITFEEGDAILEDVE